MNKNLTAFTKAIYIIIPFSIFLCIFNSHAQDLDAPHDSGFGAGCQTCHDMVAFSEPNLIPTDSFTPDAANDDWTVYNTKCWECHNDSIAPKVQSHSSQQAAG